MQISERHIIFRATGLPDKNGNIYTKDMTMEIPESIPITIAYDKWNCIGHARNAVFEDGELVADIVNADQTVTINGKFPGVCLVVDDAKDGTPISHVKLYCIGIDRTNVDPEILPIEAGEHFLEDK